MQFTKPAMARVDILQLHRVAGFEVTRLVVDLRVVVIDDLTMPAVYRSREELVSGSGAPAWVDRLSNIR